VGRAVARAPGRRQLLEAGALDAISKCLDANAMFEERGLNESGTSSAIVGIKPAMMNEACSACHGFLAGRFGLHDMDLDPEFDKPYKSLEKWKAEMLEDQDFESTKSFDGLGPVQRRKLHIVCAFLQLPHNSVGGIGNRSVVAGPVKDPSAQAPAPTKAAVIKEGAKSALGAASGALKGAIEKKTKTKPAWLVDYEAISPGPAALAAEDEIYSWCWSQTASAHSSTAENLSNQMINLHASETGLLQFHAVDLLLKIVEHDLDKEEDQADMSAIFMNTLKYDKNHHHALMGATGMHLLIKKRGLYREYGERSKTLQGIKLFRWAAQVVKTIMWWHINADGMPDFASGESGLEM